MRRIDDPELHLLAALEFLTGMLVPESAEPGDADWEGHDGYFKCDVVLRVALCGAGRWNFNCEKAFNDVYEADETAFGYYQLICSLATAPGEGPRLIDGAGDLFAPSAARYTECRITDAGRVRLADLREKYAKEASG